MSFTADRLITKVLALAPDAAGYWVAFSGGLDSQVLLHALASGRERLPAPLGAFHVNHNLQPDAPAWAEHCRAVCAALAVDYRVLSVQALPAPGESPEAAARAARYRAFAEALPPGHVLLTAHHQDDQAETLLLQLLRGAGPKGLAGMPPVAALGPGRLVRPLLDVGRAALRRYAEDQGLHWIEDPSNAHTGFDRNFLRHRILPLLQERWPAVAAVLARSARHQAEAALLLDELAGDGGQTTVSAVQKPWSVPISISRLLALSAPRRTNLLRHWLHRNGALTPSAAVLAHIERDVLRAAADALPQVCWGGVCVRRYRDGLFLDGEPNAPQPAEVADWDAAAPLTLAGGVLTPQHAPGQGVAARHLAGHRLRVAFRHGGERLQPVGRREHHSLKHLFQDAGVPPWERARIPLLYLDATLIAVAGYWVCEGFQAVGQEPGVGFLWRRAIVPDGSIW